MGEDKLQMLEGQLGRTRVIASLAITVALIAFAWVAIAFVVNHSQADSIRDLQRRVGELERRK